MQTATFTFNGIPGFVTRTLKDTFVQWGTASFQIEAAKPALRDAIEHALQNAAQAQQQAHRRVYVGGLSRTARRAQY